VLERRLLAGEDDVPFVLCDAGAVVADANDDAAIDFGDRNRDCRLRVTVFDGVVQQLLECERERRRAFHVTLLGRGQRDCGLGVALVGRLDDRLQQLSHVDRPGVFGFERLRDAAEFIAPVDNTVDCAEDAVHALPVGRLVAVLQEVDVPTDHVHLVADVVAQQAVEHVDALFALASPRHVTEAYQVARNDAVGAV